MALRIRKSPIQHTRHHGGRLFGVIGKVVRGVVAGVIVLSTFAIVGGTAYMWQAGGSEPGTRTVYRKSGTASKPAASFGITVLIQSLTSPVAPGANASVAVKTSADAKCTIDVMYDKTNVSDPALAQKTADKSGIVGWAWQVAPTAPEGTWPVKVVCAVKKDSSMTQGELVISKSKTSSQTSTAPAPATPAPTPAPISASTPTPAN